MLKPEVKKKWLEMLRSYEYKQGYGQLKQGDTYCCLGVLCEAYGQMTGKKVWGTDGIAMEKWVVLPIDMLVWSGMGEYEDDEISNLISMNDYYHSTFSEIADYIDKKL